MYPKRLYLIDDLTVIKCFLICVSHWFTSPGNSLYGRRDEVEAELLRFMREKTEPESDPNLIYVVAKFQSEWLAENSFFPVE